jgi:hypothetical protein
MQGITGYKTKYKVVQVGDGLAVKTGDTGTIRSFVPVVVSC